MKNEIMNIEKTGKVERCFNQLDTVVERSRYAAEKTKIVYTPIRAQFRAPFKKGVYHDPYRSKTI